MAKHLVELVRSKQELMELRKEAADDEGPIGEIVCDTLDYLLDEKASNPLDRELNDEEEDESDDDLDELDEELEEDEESETTNRR